MPEYLAPGVYVEETSFRAKSIEGVGNYALQPIWSDGHSYGIYSWQYLRQLSPGGDV